jgi:hypothetical protein
VAKAAIREKDMVKPVTIKKVAVTKPTTPDPFARVQAGVAVSLTGKIASIPARPKATAKPDIQTVVSASLLHMALPWCWQNKLTCKHEDITRVLVEPAQGAPGGYVIASNAKCMFVGYDPEAIIPRRATVDVPPICQQVLVGKGARARSVQFTKEHVRVLQDGEIVTEETIIGITERWLRPSGAWPDWKRQIPTKEVFESMDRCLPETLNCDILLKIGQMFDGWLEDRAVCFSTAGFHATKEGLPMAQRTLFTFFPFNRNIFLLFAPMDEPDEKNFAFPPWIDFKHDPAAGL